MSREKQIEEMAEITSRDCGNCNNCKYVGMKGDGVDCIDYFFANTLYNAGYRKQEQGVWIFEHEFYGKMLCSNCKEEALVNECNEYVDSDFCPNCGAKMKGADNEQRAD